MNSGLIVGSVISNSQINNSKTKASYSFSKTERFKNKSNLVSSGASMYKLPDVLNKRATTLGVGARVSFESKNKYAAPFYSIPSDFDVKKNLSRAFSFGISRHYYNKVNFLTYYFF